MPLAEGWTTATADQALRKLLNATLRQERLIAERDAEVAHIEQRYGPRLTQTTQEIATINQELEEFCRSNRDVLEAIGQKHLTLQFGVIGLRAPANPALVPLTEAWNWERIAAKVKKLFGAKCYFHPPKPPGLDKNKIKREFSAAELKKCGLKLDDEDRFYVELNRLAVAEAEDGAAA